MIRKSAMKIIFVADIFGVTAELEDLCQSICANHQILDPYQKQRMYFANEQVAYDYFITHVGINGYSRMLQEYLQTLNEPCVLVGFSVGGVAIWQVLQWLVSQESLRQRSTKLGKLEIKQSICFYSSQIRHALAQKIIFPTRIILPKSEPHFSVENVKAALINKINVTVENTAYLHGFMNELSDNYNEAGCRYYCQKLTQMIEGNAKSG